MGNVDPTELLPLAHRYELSELVARCANAMLKQVSVENVVQIVQTMCIFKDHEEVKTLWSRLVTLVREDQIFSETVLCHARV